MKNQMYKLASSQDHNPTRLRTSQKNHIPKSLTVFPGHTVFRHKDLLCSFGRLCLFRYLDRLFRVVRNRSRSIRLALCVELLGIPAIEQLQFFDMCFFNFQRLICMLIGVVWSGVVRKLCDFEHPNTSTHPLSIGPDLHFNTAGCTAPGAAEAKSYFSEWCIG